MTQVDFFTAVQMHVVMPEEYAQQDEFVSTAQYPRGFEPDDGEFGMIVKDGKIQERLFCIPEHWPW